MGRGPRAAFRIAALGIWVTGALWLALRTFGQTSGDFGPQPHPGLPWILRLHGALAMLILVGLGAVWRSHAGHGWRCGRRRFSGGALLAATLALIASGWGLYYAWGGDDLRELISRAHWVIGLGAPLAWIGHRLRLAAARPYDRDRPAKAASTTVSS